ncbi:hypothetical protein [Thiopseudomonas alkaliphila]|uniref:hypothetical protein n=1 Tax=Thiopseudomonas alkaliphila TaxID=1697053 RepID=UPI002574D944|nr:hypothetical protein [Thiopseudomonas alkaliphila]MDM1717365.1 hypothetical protein [Thiopseudomonas alkaliphila]
MTNGHFFYDLLIFLFRHGAELFFYLAVFLVARFIYKNRTSLKKTQGEQNNKTSSNDELLSKISEVEKFSKRSKNITHSDVVHENFDCAQKKENEVTNAVTENEDEFYSSVDTVDYDIPTYIRRSL